MIYGAALRRVSSWLRPFFFSFTFVVGSLTLGWSAPPVFRGRVIHDDTGDPLRGVQVTVVERSRYRPGESKLPPFSVATTDEAGLYEIAVPEVATWSSFYVVHHKEGFVSYRRNSHWSPEGSDPHLVRMVPGQPIKIVAVRPTNRKPLDDVWISVRGQHREQQMIAGTSTYVPHYFEGPGPYVVWAPTNSVAVGIESAYFSGGYGRQGAPSDGVLTIPLKLRGRVAHGRIVDGNGNPVPGVSANGSVTDSDGNFSLFVWGEREEATVHLTHPEYFEATVKIPVDCEERPTQTIERGRVLAFRLLEPTGRVVPRVHRLQIGEKTVQCWLWNGVYRTAAMTAETTSASYVLPNYEDLELSWEAGVGTIDLGTIHAKWVNPIPITVLDETGAPIRYAGIRYEDDYRTSTDKDGRATVSCIPAGPATLSIKALRHRPKEISLNVVEGANSPVTVRLERGAEVLLELRDPDGPRVRMATALVIPDPNAEGREANEQEYKGHYNRNLGQHVFPNLPEGLPFTIEITAYGQSPIRLEQPPLTEKESRDLGVVKFPRGLELAGVVVNDIGEPVPGASIRVVSRAGRYTAQSRSDGRFTVQRLLRGRYEIQVSRPGHKICVGDVAVPAEEGVLPTYVLTRKVAHRIQLRYEDGRVVETPTTVLLGDAAERWATGFVSSPDDDRFYVDEDDKGMLELPPQPAGPVRMTIRCGWRDPIELTFHSPDRMPEEIVLPSGHHVRVTIETPDGSEPRSILIGPGDLEPSHSWGLDYVERQEDGSYVFHDLRPDIRTLTVQAGSFALPPGQEIVPSTDGSPQHMHFVLPPHETQYVVWVRDADGSPVNGAKVRLARGYHGSIEGETLQTGECEFIFLPQIDSIRVVAEGFPNASYRAAEIETAPGCYEIQLRRACNVEVQVVDDNGAPLPVCRVSVTAVQSGGSEDTDADGYAVFRSLNESEATFQLSRERQNLYRFRRKISCDSGPIVLQLPPRYRIQGSIRINGVPVDGGEVHLNCEYEGEKNWQQQYRGPVSPDGTFDLDAFSAGPARLYYNSQRDFSWDEPPDDTVPQLPGLYETVEISGDETLQIDFPIHEFTGIVLGLGGGPAGKCRVYSQGDSFGSVTSDDQGAFRLLLRPGESRLKVFAEGADLTRELFLPTPIRVPEQTHVTITATAVYAVPLHLGAGDWRLGRVAPAATAVGSYFSYHFDGEGQNHSVYLPAGEHELVLGAQPLHTEATHYYRGVLTVQVPYSGTPIAVDLQQGDEPLPRVLGR